MKSQNTRHEYRGYSEYRETQSRHIEQYIT